MTSILIPSKSHSRFTSTLVLLTLAALGMTTLLALLPETGHDQLWLLLAAQRMLPHLNPYGPTVFESNPPLAIWLSALVVTLSRLLHLPLTVTFKLAVSLVALASALISSKLLRRLNPALTPPKLWLLAIAFLLIFGAIPARDFGQRDHILTLLILPYLLAAALPLRWVPHDHLEPAGRKVIVGSLTPVARLPITLLAALGLALKPHQALIPIAVEVNLFLLSRRVFKNNSRVPHDHPERSARRVILGSIPPNRPRLLEPAIFLLSALTYYIAIRLFAPTYLTEVLPILRDTYWAFGQLTLPQLLLSAIQLILLAAIAIAFYLRKRPATPLVPIFLAAALAATLAYLLQGTGWYYQQLPAISLFVLALTLQLLNTRRAPFIAPRSHAMSGKSTEILPAVTLLFTVLALMLTTYFSHFDRHLEQPQPIPDPIFFASLPPNTPVATLTTSVDDTVPPAFRYHLILAQRSPHLWMLPAILRNQSGPTPRHPIPPARLAELTHLQQTFMVEDLTRWQPYLILVARCQDPAVHCQVLEDRHDDLLAFFLRDPAFAAIFSHYRLTRTAGPYDAYTLR